MVLKIIAVIVGLIVGVMIGAIGSEMIGLAPSTKSMITSTIALICGAIGWKLASKS